MGTNIEIIIPEDFMNCWVTLDNNFVADNNNSTFPDSLKFPLPKTNKKECWGIYNQKWKIITLHIKTKWF